VHTPTQLQPLHLRLIRSEQRHARHFHTLDLVLEAHLHNLLDDLVHRDVHADHRRHADLLDAVRHRLELAVLASLQAVPDHRGLDLVEEHHQVLLPLTRLDLEVSTAANATGARSAEARGCADVRARPLTQPVQGVRGQGDVRARPPTQPVQGVRGQGDM
jgi:hypothetical protein